MNIKFKRFEPITLDAKIKINELIKRGGAIVAERREFIDIERFQSIARIDQKGRVEWRPK